MGGNQRVAFDRREVVRLGGSAGGVEPFRIRAQLEGRPQRRRVPVSRKFDRSDEARRKDAAGDLRPRDEHARIDRPVVRRRRVQGRQPDGLDAFAGESPAAGAARDDAAAEARERAVHLRRRRGLLRPQRLRRLLVGSGADREGNRPARYACNGCARTSTAGTPKARRRCSTIEPAR